MKITLNIASGTFTMNSTPPTNGLGLFEIIGGADNNTAESSTLLTWTSPNVVQMVPRCVLVNCPTLPLYNWASSNGDIKSIDKTRQSSLLTQVPVTVPANDLINYQDNEAREIFAPRKKIQHIEFYLEDQDGLDLDLNGGNWTIVLEIGQLTEESWKKFGF